MKQPAGKKDRLTIEAHALRVCYGNTLALSIEEMHARGKIIAVIGHNGSGKSTLLKSILELNTPQSGHVAAYLNGEASRRKLIPEEHMAFSQENGGVFGDISVEEYLKLWCRIKHRDAAYYRKQHFLCLEELSIPPLFKKLGRQLSKGQRQRVQAAVGFIIQPELFLFDEPFDGLDIGQSIQLARVMQRKSAEMTMILSSHRMEVVERLADEIILLQEGKLRCAGSTAKVCEEISGSTLAVRYARRTNIHQQTVLNTLRTHFEHCLVQQIGDQLAVTGTTVTKSDLQAALNGMNLSDIVISSSNPSLVDAMQFHLRSHVSTARVPETAN